MAKFAIAVYILLVASVTCDDSISANSLKVTLNAQLTGLQEISETLSDAFANATDKVQNITEEIRTEFETAVSEWKDKLENATAAYDDVSSCVSSSTNLTETATKLFNGTVTCVAGVIGDLINQFVQVVNSKISLVSEIKELVEEAEKCTTSDSLTSTTCITILVVKKLPTIIANVTKAIADATSLVWKFQNISTDLQACGISTAVKVITTDGQEVIEETRTCLANLNSTSA